MTEQLELPVEHDRPWKLPPDVRRAGLYGIARARAALRAQEQERPDRAEAA